MNTDLYTQIKLFQSKGSFKHALPFCCEDGIRSRLFKILVTGDPNVKIQITNITYE